MALILFGKLLMANIRSLYHELRLTKDPARRNWDEKRVGEWLRVINCAQYERLFKGKLARPYISSGFATSGWKSCET